jgi:long-chain fatty acid transport protein
VNVNSQDGSSGSANLKGNGNGYSFNAGLYYKASEKLSIGLSYRSQIKVKVSGGDATLTTPASLSSAIPASNKFSSSLPLPQVLSLGFGIKPTEKLLITVDVNWVGWSAYDKLEFDYEKNSSNTAGVNLENTVADRKYKDIMAYRVGAQYMLFEKFAVRGGVAYGASPVANGYVNPDVPDADRANLSCGIGYQMNEHFSVDAAFLYEMLNKRTGTYSDANFTRTYKGVAYVPSIQLNYTF